MKDLKDHLLCSVMVSMLSGVTPPFWEEDWKIRPHSLAEWWRLNVDTIFVIARCFNGAGGLNVHEFQIPQHHWPTNWNASTLDDSREHKALWKKIAPVQRAPHLFQEVDWYAGQFRHGFQPSLVPIGLDQLDVPILWERRLQTRRPASPPPPGLGSLDCGPLGVPAPRLDAEEAGWLQLPKQPVGDEALDDLRITAELEGLCKNRPRAEMQLTEWVRFWIRDHPDPSVLEANVGQFLTRLLFLDTCLPAPLEHSFLLEEGIGIFRNTMNPVNRPAEDLAILHWLNMLETVLADKPDHCAARPAAFIQLWCQLLTQRGALCWPGLCPGSAVWQAFQGILALWTVELRCRNSSGYGAASSPLSMKKGKLLSKPFASWGCSGTIQRSFQQAGPSLSRAAQWLTECHHWSFWAAAEYSPLCWCAAFAHRKSMCQKGSTIS